MKSFLISLFLMSCVSITGAVEPPKTEPASRYYSLWKNSAITDKPEVEKPGEGPNDLEDWVLVGLEEYVTGKVVTLVNKKNPRERLRVPGPDEAAKEFAILQVIKGESSYLDTKVILQKGKHRGEVAFDSKYLVLRKAPPAGNKKQANKKQNNGRNANLQRKVPPNPTPTPSTSPLPTGAKPAGNANANSQNARPPARQRRAIPTPSQK